MLRSNLVITLDRTLTFMKLINKRCRKRRTLSKSWLELHNERPPLAFALQHYHLFIRQRNMGLQCDSCSETRLTMRIFSGTLRSTPLDWLPRLGYNAPPAPRSSTTNRCPYLQTTKAPKDQYFDLDVLLSNSSRP